MRYGTTNIEATKYVNGIAFCIRIRSAPNFKSGRFVKDCVHVEVLNLKIHFN